MARVRRLLPGGKTIEGSIEQTREISEADTEEWRVRSEINITRASPRDFGPSANLASVWQGLSASS